MGALLDSASVMDQVVGFRPLMQAPSRPTLIPTAMTRLSSPSASNRTALQIGLVALMATFPLFAQVGSLDPAFGADGLVIHDRDETDIGHAVHLEPDGSLVVFGESEQNGVPQTRVAVLKRFDSDGTLSLARSYVSTGFGCAGVPIVFFAGTRLGNGNYLGAGYQQHDCAGVAWDFLVMLIGAGGNILVNFERPDFFGNQDAARDIAVYPDGRIAAVGWAARATSSPHTWDAAVARYLADGTMDDSFDFNGEMTIDVSGTRDQLQSVALQDDGKIVAVGFTDSAGHFDFLVVRLNEDGSLDSSFNGNGILVQDFHGLNDSLTGVAIQPDGKIVVSGISTAADTSQRLTVARYHSNGSPDTSFDGDGVVFVDFGGSMVGGTDVFIDPSNRIYVAGTVETDTGIEDSRDFAVALLQIDGSLDPAFNGDGRRIIPFAAGPIDTALAIDVDADAGRVAVVGSTGQRDMSNVLFRDFAVARLIGVAESIFADDFEAAPLP